MSDRILLNIAVFLALEAKLLPCLRVI